MYITKRKEEATNYHQVKQFSWEINDWTECKKTAIELEIIIRTTVQMSDAKTKQVCSGGKWSFISRASVQYEQKAKKHRLQNEDDN